MMVDYDVVVVGYGPVGQLASLLLGRAGRRVLAVEQWPEPFRLPRAVHFDDEVARVLQNVGLRADESPVIEPYDDLYEWRNAEGEALLSVDWRGRGAAGWHASNHFCQPELEDALCDLVAQQPTVTLQRGAKVDEVQQDEGGVTVQFRSGGEQESVRASYVIGCDGANSFVRESLGVSHHDLGFFYDWLIVDIKPHERMEFHPRAIQLCDPARPTTLTPAGPGRRRWEFMILPGEDSAQMNTAETAVELLGPWGIDGGNATLERHTMYRFQARWVERWRVGRVFLAGDAAHQMPPFAGQGMCSGFRDVVNLVWKLEDVLAGHARDNILETYQSERAPHVRDLIEYSMMLGQIICVTDPAEARKRDERMVAEGALSVPAPRPRLGAGLLSRDARAGRPSRQGVVTLDQVTALADDLLRGGWRLLVWGDAPVASVVSGAPFKLSVWEFGDGPGKVIDVEGSYRAWRKELASADRQEPWAVLVRPDAYVAAVIADAEDLTTAFEGIATYL